MPKKANDNAYTQALKRLEIDSEALGKLQTKAESDKATPADKEAFKRASEKLKTDRLAITRLRMRFVGGATVNKVVNGIKGLSSLTNRKQYDLTAADLEKIKSALETNTAAVIETLTAAVNNPHSAPVSRDAITFD